MYFLYNKTTRWTNFPNLLQHETQHVLGSSSAHHQEFIRCTLITGICHTGLKRAFEQDQDGTPLHILLYHIAAFVLYSFSLVFLYWYVSFACLALTNFMFMWPCIIPIFFIIKPTRFTIFPNLIWHETLHALYQEFIHCTLLVLLKSCLQTCMMYTSAKYTVNKHLIMGRGTARNM